MTTNVGDNTNICPECSAWDESMKGIYICWVCGSPEMVKRANEPNAYDDLLRRLREAVKEIKEMSIKDYGSAVTLEQKEAQLIKTASFDGARHIIERYIPELEDK